MSVPHHLEPVGVFWDIENCSVPLEKSALGIATKMKQEFFRGKREAEFMCVCDISKERKEVVDDLNKAHVGSQLIWTLFTMAFSQNLCLNSLNVIHLLLLHLVFFKHQNHVFARKEEVYLL